MGRRHEQKVHNKRNTLAYKYMTKCSTSVKSSNKTPFLVYQLKFERHYRGTCILLEHVLIVGGSNVGFNALHKECNCFFPLFFFYPQAVIILTWASYFSSSNNVGYVCTESLIQVVESRYFGEGVCSREEMSHTFEYPWRERYNQQSHDGTYH